jgi:hypothetical protein
MNNNVIHQNIDTVKNIIFAAKVKGGKFFTHIAAKKYFKKNILTQTNTPLNNKIIINGDYDIKAYGSMINGIKDYLNTLELTANEVIMIHPFTPVEIVDVIKGLGLKIIFYTIDSDTLSLTKESFENMVIVQKPKLIIHYTINQLLAEITQEIEFVEKNKTELLIIDNNTSHNSEYFELINTMQSGAYYQLLSDNFQNQIIDDLTGINVEKNSIYINLIFGKDLLTSITPKVIPNLELHNELADTLYQLLFNQEKQKGIVNSLRNSLIKQTLSSQKNMTITQLNESFEQIFNRIKNDEIPDYIFELVNSLDIKIDSQDLILNKNLLENRNSKKLKIQNIIQNNQKDSNLATIPKSCVFRDVTTFHIQSQDQKEWYNTLKYGGLVFYRLPYPHDDIFNSLDSNTDSIINDTLVSIL